jgi:hypothetical protein
VPDQATGSSLLFDNGSREQLSVKLESAAPFTVPPGDHAVVQSAYGPHKFAVCDSADPTWQEWAVDVNDTWIDNHRAAWDYRTKAVMYSNAPFKATAVTGSAPMAAPRNGEAFTADGMAQLLKKRFP